MGESRDVGYDAMIALITELGSMIREMDDRLGADIEKLSERLRQVELQLKGLNGIGERVHRLEEMRYKLAALALLLVFLGSSFGNVIISWFRSVH